MDFEFDFRRVDSPLSEWRKSSLMLLGGRLEVSLLEALSLRRFSLLSLVDERRNESLLLLLVDDRLKSSLLLLTFIEDRTLLRLKALLSFLAKVSSRDN